MQWSPGLTISVARRSGRSGIAARQHDPGAPANRAGRQHPDPRRLGRRVRDLLLAHAATTDFLAPDAAFQEAGVHLPSILKSRGATDDALLAAENALAAVWRLVTPIPVSSYESNRQDALARIGSQDPHDWPVLACALLLTCPIWTEDRDFFGTGVATWTTQTITLFLEGSKWRALLARRDSSGTARDQDQSGDLYA